MIRTDFQIACIPCCVWTAEPRASSLSSLQFFPVRTTAVSAALTLPPLAFDIWSSSFEWPSLAVDDEEWLSAPCADLLWRMRRGRKLTWITGKFTAMAIMNKLANRRAELGDQYFLFIIH